MAGPLGREDDEARRDKERHKEIPLYGDTWRIYSTPGVNGDGGQAGDGWAARNTRTSGTQKLEVECNEDSTVIP